MQKLGRSLTGCRIRAACSDALLADYKRAQDQNAEERLWDSHQKVNNHYRTALTQVRVVTLACSDIRLTFATQFKKATESKPVEQRKLGAEYLKFIKSSQKFYRGFVGRLAKVYGDIPALQRVAKKLGPSGRTIDHCLVVRSDCSQILPRQQTKTPSNLDHSNWSNAVIGY